ncbi:hypothetical protein Acsp03_43720 [Actinomadura sp. NBRC 104412]|nr:hypothetical protein Acsp03_43720 [Actinomadura sp. NBRC 104412]
MEERAARPGAAPDCVLCPPLRFRFNEMADLPGEPAVLAADDDFFLMPDLAPLVEGHLLLVASRHVQCAGAFGKRLWAGAWQWRHRAGRVYQAAYGSSDLLLLEHGPATSQGGGACVDHVHWHLLPVPDGTSGESGAPGVRSVRALLEEQGLPGVPATRDAVHRRYLAGRSYLMVEEQGLATVHPGDGVASQHLRRAALRVLCGDADGQPWRWQERFGLPGSRVLFQRTLDVLRPAVALDDELQRASRTASHQ